MAVIKSWEAHDIQMLQLRLDKVGTDIVGQRDFVFIDDQLQPVAEIGLQLYQETIAIADIPANILSALQTIDNWFYSRIIQKVQE